MITGSCLCGAIKFNITNVGARIAHCHCNMCQKFHGAAFSTFAEVDKQDFNLTKGEGFISEYIAENKTVRSFCSNCGASLFFESQYNRQDHSIEVALAAFDHVDVAHQIKPDAHIFTESKAQWLDINDELEKHKTYRSDCSQ